MAHNNEHTQITHIRRNEDTKAFEAFDGEKWIEIDVQNEVVRQKIPVIVAQSELSKLNVGTYNTITGKHATARGQNCEASADRSHAEGFYATAEGKSSHAEGLQTEAKGRYSHAEGMMTTASGMRSHAEGSATLAQSDGSHAEGNNTESKGRYSHAEGNNTGSNGFASHAEGMNTQAVGNHSHAEGGGTSASKIQSHSEGANTKADHEISHAAGKGSLTEGKYDHVHGGDNEADSPATSNNIFRINGNGVNGNAGDVTASGAFSGGGADYAESFEWNDGNSNEEDRAGYFVSLVNGDKIEISGAAPIGIVSPLPAVLGDAQYLKYKNVFETDDFGRTIRDPYQVTTYVEQEEQEETEDQEAQERIEYKVYKDSEGNLFTEVPNPTNKSGTQFTGELPSNVTWDETIQVKRVHPDFDPEKEYKNRHERPEWDAVGLIGKLVVYDDGNANAGDKVVPKADGTAEKSTDGSGYHVLKRVNTDKVQVLFK
jgi:hypothetical protein